MRLSAPIYRLKRQAKLLSREDDVPLHEALNRVAKAEGFQSWSHLAASYDNAKPARKILAELTPGDFVLLGARPGHGKTLLALEIVVEAIRSGRQGAFFTLDYNERDVLQRLRSINAEPEELGSNFVLNTSDEISADYIIDELDDVPGGAVIAVDYLQVLDQKRDNPEINQQGLALKRFAQPSGHTIILISQIDRSYALSAKTVPDLTDVRLPNPLDLRQFSKTCFLDNGEMVFGTVG